jgi:serine protease Do
VRRGRLGVTVQGIDADLAASLRLPSISGALVSDVEEDGPADRAGLKRGDVITEMNGERIDDSNELRNRIAIAGPNAKIDLTIFRDGETGKVSATLGELASKSASNGSARSEDSERTAGLVVEPLTPERARELRLGEDASGLLVRQVQPDGPAAEAGIRAGDVIQQVDGESVKSAEDLRSALKSGDRPALVLVQRGQQHLFLSLDRLS